MIGLPSDEFLHHVSLFCLNLSPPYVTLRAIYQRLEDVGLNI